MTLWLRISSSGSKMLRTKVAKSTINWAHTQAELHTRAIQLCKEPSKKERLKQGGRWWELPSLAPPGTERSSPDDLVKSQCLRSHKFGAFQALWKTGMNFNLYVIKEKRLGPPQIRLRQRWWTGQRRLASELTLTLQPTILFEKKNGRLTQRLWPLSGEQKANLDLHKGYEQKHM